MQLKLILTQIKQISAKTIHVITNMTNALENFNSICFWNNINFHITCPHFTSAMPAKTLFDSTKHIKFVHQDRQFMEGIEVSVLSPINHISYGTQAAMQSNVSGTN